VVPVADFDGVGGQIKGFGQSLQHIFFIECFHQGVSAMVLLAPPRVSDRRVSGLAEKRE